MEVHGDNSVRTPIVAAGDKLIWNFQPTLTESVINMPLTPNTKIHCRLLFCYYHASNGISN